jgi:transposase-like protein
MIMTTYAIHERKAIQKFRSHLTDDPGAIQMVLPLAEIAHLLRQGVSQPLHETEVRLLLTIIENEVVWMTGERYARQPKHRLQRGSYANGSVVVHGQKVPISRPRLRDRQGDVTLGSYELFRREEEIQRQIWERIMRGLTMRGYAPAVREGGTAFGVEKSAVSDRFIQARAKRAQELLNRDLRQVRLCALMLDGVEFKGEHILTALGIDRTGRKVILGLHQGGSEN